MFRMMCLLELVVLMFVGVVSAAAYSELDVAKMVPYVRKAKDMKGYSSSVVVEDILRIARIDPTAITDEQLREAVAIIATREWIDGHYVGATLSAVTDQVTEKIFKLEGELYKMYPEKTKDYYEAAHAAFIEIAPELFKHDVQRRLPKINALRAKYVPMP
ncbi:MAG: hypothetical protein WCD80_01650 [Desulfobaccales bacterium]